MERRREGDDVWRKEDREVSGVEKGKESAKRERESVDKRDGRPACISFFITIAPI
jgi:hypothetical protein